MEILILVAAIALVAVALLGFVRTRRRPSGPSAAQEIAALRQQHDPDAATTQAPPVDVATDISTPPRFRDRLQRTRESLGLSSLFGRDAIDASLWDDLEEALIRADVGVRTTMRIIDDVKLRSKEQSLNAIQLSGTLREELVGLLEGLDRELHLGSTQPTVWLFVGVNGVGKTTTIGKLANREVTDGRSVLLAAGDTFRAAAGEQLETWAQRADVEVVRGQEGGDPAAVIFDAVERAAARKTDLVLADTAGRLQNKTNLMNELAKVRKVASREPASLTEVLLVIDATTGQNGLSQAKEFLDVAGVTGVVLTKLDGTAKGGIALAIEVELGIPVKLVGLGEGIGDLIPFDPEAYVDALLAQ